MEGVEILSGFLMPTWRSSPCGEGWWEGWEIRTHNSTANKVGSRASSGRPAYSTQGFEKHVRGVRCPE